MIKRQIVRCPARVAIALLSVSAVYMIHAATALAGVVTYTDKNAWQNALGGPFLTEDFNDSMLNSGVSFTSSESAQINPALGHFQDVLTSTSNNEPTTVWSFSPPIAAYGGNWTLGGPGGSGNSLLVYIEDSNFYVGAIGNSYDGGFWGFISDTPFTSVRLIGSTGQNQQNYKLDDMVYAPVPEPASLCLYGAGLVGIFLAVRRSRLTL